MTGDSLRRSFDKREDTKFKIVNIRFIIENCCNYHNKIRVYILLSYGENVEINYGAIQSLM